MVTTGHDYGVVRRRRSIEGQDLILERGEDIVGGRLQEVSAATGFMSSERRWYRG
jgi:hypothetical protein